MAHVVLVHVQQARHELAKVLLRFGFQVATLQSVITVRSQVSSGGELHDNVTIAACLERIVRKNNVWVLEVLGDKHFVLQAPLNPKLLVRVGQVEHFNCVFGGPILVLLVGACFVYSVNNKQILDQFGIVILCGTYWAKPPSPSSLTV